MKSGPYVSVGNNWWKGGNFLKKKLPSLDIVPKLVAYLSKFFQLGRQNCSIRVRKNFFRTKRLSGNLNILFFVLGFWLSFPGFWLFLFQWVVKTPCYVLLWDFEAEKLWKRKNFLNFSVIERKLFSLLPNSFQRGSRNCFYVSLTAFSEVFSPVTNSLFIKLFYWAELFLLKLFRRFCEIWIPSVRRNILVTRLFLKKNPTFRTWSKNFSALCSKFSTGVNKTALYLFIKKFSKRSLTAFSDVFSPKIISLFIKLFYWAELFLLKIFRRFCEIWIPSVRRKILVTRIFFTKFNIIGWGAKTSRFCIASFPMELTKLHYTCSIKKFQREVFRKKVNFFINLEFWLNSSSDSGIFPLAGLSNLRTTCL